jgi:restriction endonuclease S subunit
MNQNLLKITLDENKVNPFFLQYYFESKLFKTESAKLIRGSAMEAFLPTRQLIKYKIPLPPLPIQKKIVQRLDDILEQLEEKKKAVFF